ncbi:ATP-binding protein [Amycolatopsis sp. lyj-84]|uniref:ATP-binding protein n=1 Tax=Amycolatopsis sp. lyj-84 TaxID=2789284 RepID=UPI003978DD07
MSEQATFGAELRRRRQEAGLSLTTLAERTHYSKGYLSKVETGIATPNPALAALCESELGAVGVLTALLPRSSPCRASRSTLRPYELPAAAAVFAGRTAEVRAVRNALEVAGGVCVISGMGGIGKTELAVRCAHRLAPGFVDGCLFLDLRGCGVDVPIAGSTVMHSRILRALDVPLERIPDDPDDRAAVYRSCLRGRSLLLVLDNVVSAEQVRPLLPAESKCRVLITSRSRLTSLDDARHVFLDGLNEPEAAELFVSLVRMSPGEIVARVVHHCAGLPLAIRIAAARLRAHPAWDIRELDRRLDAEVSRLSELDDGERSLQATFQLSMRQLSSEDVSLFGLLALHPGKDFDVYSASALLARPFREVDRLLDRLHDVYLLTQPSAGRYSFHDLLRLFAAESVLAAMTDRQRRIAFRRLIDFAVRSAAQADRLLFPHRFRCEIEFGESVPEIVRLDDADAAFAWFRCEWRGLVELCRVARERGEHERCWQLAYLLCRFFFMQNCGIRGS